MIILRGAYSACKYQWVSRVSTKEASENRKRWPKFFKDHTLQQRSRCSALLFIAQYTKTIRIFVCFSRLSVSASSYATLSSAAYLILVLGMFFFGKTFLRRRLFILLKQFCEFVDDFFQKVLKNFRHFNGLAAFRHFPSRQSSKVILASSSHCHLILKEYSYDNCF